jgi:energy-coupling factor transporter transmembrane protein EcfT
MVGRAKAVFKYKTVKGHLHKLPAMLKLFLFLPLSVICMSLPSVYLASGIIAAVLTAFLCGFTFREQLTDFKPSAFYASLMYGLSVFSTLFENWGSIPLPTLAATALLPRADFLHSALRLTLVVQLSALLFRTTSSVEIREALVTLERRIRLALKHLPFFEKAISPRPRFLQNISMFLSFIPEIFEAWAAVDLAWKARGGRQGAAKIKTLVFVLITLSFEKAALKSRALEAREK